MHRFLVAAFIIMGMLAGSGAALPASAASSAPLTQAERDAQLENLDWKQGGEFSLPASEGTIRFPESYSLVLGEDADRLMILTNGSSGHSEAVVMGPGNDQGAAEYTYVKEGFVSLDDWDEINPERMLKEITEGNEAANKERTKQGLETIHVKRWSTPPHLDRATNTVYWSLVAEQEDGRMVVNAVALKLGRHGYEEITGMGQSEAAATGILKIAMDAFTYKPGAAYADHKEGDKMATYGIAALVAAGVGAKVAAKVGLLGLLLILLKKAWIVFLIVPSLLKRGWRKLTGKKVEGVQAPENAAIALPPEEPTPLLPASEEPPLRR